MDLLLSPIRYITEVDLGRSVAYVRSASPFIIHETIITDGDGGCCISWQRDE